MPKRVGYLYKTMCDKELIRLAIREGSKGKRKRWDVKEVMQDEEGYIEKVYELLVTGNYVPTPSKKKTIFEPAAKKWRDIKIVPFYPDGIIHQLMVMAAKDIFMRGMYRWSCASIPKRGNKCAADYTKKALKEDVRGTKYCLKMDIRHYYPSIQTNLLMHALKRKIKDREYLDLCRAVVSSDPDGGLSIGYYTNQWLANFYLEPLDTFILTLPGVKHYVRNMDDMVLLGPNKKKLHRARIEISGFLDKKMGLELKGNWQVFLVDARGIDFVGYRFYHTHTTLRRRNFLKFTRTCRKVGKKLDAGKPVSYHLAAGLLARKGQLRHCDSAKALAAYYDPAWNQILKNIIREKAKGRDPNGRHDPGARADMQEAFRSPRACLHTAVPA